MLLLQTPCFPVAPKGRMGSVCKARGAQQVACGCWVTAEYCIHTQRHDMQGSDLISGCLHRRLLYLFEACSFVLR